MTAETHLIAELEKLVKDWLELAIEARQRADQRRPGDLDPAYLYDLAEGLERDAAALREVINRHKVDD